MIRPSSRRPRFAAFAALAVSALATSIPIASAQPAPGPAQLTEARGHFDQAEAYLQAEAFADAAASYQAAYAVIPNPVLLFNIGLAWEKHGDLEAAVTHYDRYLAADPGGIKAVEARARRAALATKVTAARTDAERGARGRQLRQDAAAHTAAGRHAEALAALEEAQALVPDPEHDFALGEAYLAAGDRVRAESAYRRYQSGAGTARRDDAAARLAELSKPEVRPGSPGLLPEVVAYSAAGIAIAIGIGFGLRADGHASELEEGIDSGMPPLDTGDDRFGRGETDALTANVAFGIAAAATVVGAYFTVRRLRSRPAAGATDGLTLAPVRSSGHGAALAYEVRW